MTLRDSGARGDPQGHHHDNAGAVARDLAEMFLGDVAGRPEPWQQLLLPWAADHGVTVNQMKGLQREIVRQRVFGHRRGQR